MTRHYILTRFNIRLWTSDKRHQATQTDEWMKARLRLFERYTLPSVAAQTQKDFKWLVLFDRETTLPYRDLLTAFKETCPMLHPVFVRPDAGQYFTTIFQQVIERDIRQDMQQGITTDKLITTYLDSDDALASDYVATVRREAVSLPDNTYITFYYGLQYHEELNMATCVRYRENHFNSYVEVPDVTGHVLTSYHCSHAQIFKAGQYRIHAVKMRKHPMWTEVVHPRNVRNDILLRRLTWPVTDRELLRSRFSINQTTRAHAVRFFLTRFQWETLKAYYRYALRRIRGEW